MAGSGEEGDKISLAGDSDRLDGDTGDVVDVARGLRYQSSAAAVRVEGVERGCCTPLERPMVLLLADEVMQLISQSVRTVE